MTDKLTEVLDIVITEPNTETFEYKGYKCLIRRTSHGGNLNGYVGLPKGHRFYEKHYDDLNIDCHGGLTWGDFWKDQNDDLWYIGFDTAHSGDYLPFEQMFNRHRVGWSWLGENETYRDINYVRQECKNIVDQIS